MEIDTPTDLYIPIALGEPMEEPSDDNEMPNSEGPPNKRRRKKSIVWEHFSIETVGPDCKRACCKQCKKSFAYITGTKLAGTSHLKRHISLGICPAGRQKNEASQHAPAAKSDPPKRRYRASPGYASIPFDQDRCTRDIAKMIIQHDYPLHIVEQPAFIEFVRTLHPQNNMVSFNTIQGECVALYLREKQSLLDHISGIPGRVNLSLDLATSNLSIGYAFVTGHFIDNDWILHRLILNVIMLPFPDSDYAFNQAVVSCRSDWHLESKLLTFTLDKSFSNETMIGNLRGLLSVKNSLLLNGQLVKGDCYARVLSQLAQEAMGMVQEPIRRVRECVKYVKTSETHDEKFTELRQQLQVPSTRELIIDDQTKWNTTYQMLVAACDLKEVFNCLDTADPVYKINPSVNDWKQVEILCTYLKLFFDAANILTSPMYPPANAFYHEVSKIQLELTHAAMSQDPFVSSLTKPLKERFDQYWKECFLVLAIAVVMDPRFKMKLVEFSFSKIFGEDAGSWIKIVDDGIHELFQDYIAPRPVATLMVQENTHAQINQLEYPNEVVLVPPVDGPSQEFSALEGHSQEQQPEEAKPQDLHPPESYSEMHNQELYDREMAPQDIKSGDLHPQEISSLDMHRQDAYAQEMHYQELPSAEISVGDMHPQDLPQGIDTQQVPCQDMHTQELPQGIDTQEVLSQAMHTQELSQGIDAEEVSGQEMQAPDVAPLESKVQEEPLEEMGRGALSEEAHMLEARSQGMMQDVEVLGQQMQAPDVAPLESRVQEEPSEEMGRGALPEEAHMPEAQTQEMMQDVEVPGQEMQAPDVTPLESKVQEEPLEEMGRGAEEAHMPEAQPQEMMQDVGFSSQDTQNDEVHPVEPSSQDTQSQEMHLADMHPQEFPSQEIQPQEVPLGEMATEVVSQEVHQLEAQTQETMQQVEPSSEDIHNREVLPGEMDSEELPSQEIQPREVQPSQDMHMQEEPMSQEGEPMSQEVCMEEVQPSQDVHRLEAQTQEMMHQVEPSSEDIHNQEVLTGEMDSEELPSQEIQPQEVQPSQDMHMQEEPTSQNSEMQEIPIAQVVHLQEVPLSQEFDTAGASAHEITSLGATTQEILSQELPAQEMLTQEGPLQEMPSRVIRSQEVQNQNVQYAAMNSQDLPMLSVGDGLSDFDVYISEISSNQHMKSELDQYLEESLLPRVQEFDVLGWWKLNKLKYPTLSKLAADILSIPISTVGPDSVFDTRNKKIDGYRSSLHPLTLEALICAKDWLQYGSSLSASQFEASNVVLKLEY